MKVLMISEILTHPSQMGNQQRIYRECLQMKQRGWEIDFLYVGKRIDESVTLTKVFFGEGHFFQHYRESLPVKSQIKKKIRTYMDAKGISRFCTFRYGNDEWCLTGLADHIRYLNEKKQYDIIWLQYMFFSECLEQLDDLSALRVIDTHDKWANRNRIFQRKGQIPDYYYTTVRGERRSLRRADLVIAIQEKEAQYFERLLKNTDTKVLVIGDLVEERRLPVCDNYCYGCIGAKNKPNILGLTWFCENVLPIVREKCPESRFMIAGGVCGCIPDYAGVYKMGKVERLEDFYNNVKVTVNPIQSGTGLNIKTIEALAFGKPLVSTSMGSKGICSEKEVLIECDQPRVFAEKIVELLQNNEQCACLSRNAQEYIEKYNEKNIERLYSIESYIGNGR